jgi:hypothetical protein
MSNKAKCDTFLERFVKINWKYGVTRFSDDHSMCFLFQEYQHT